MHKWGVTFSFSLPLHSFPTPVSCSSVKSIALPTSSGLSFSWASMNQTHRHTIYELLASVVGSFLPVAKYEFRVATVNKFGIGSFNKSSEVITTKAPSVRDLPHQTFLYYFGIVLYN